MDTTPLGVGQQATKSVKLADIEDDSLEALELRIAAMVDDRVIDRESRRHRTMTIVVGVISTVALGGLGLLLKTAHTWITQELSISRTEAELAIKTRVDEFTAKSGQAIQDGIQAEVDRRVASLDQRVSSMEDDMDLIYEFVEPTIVYNDDVSSAEADHLVEVAEKIAAKPDLRNRIIVRAGIYNLMECCRDFHHERQADKVEALFRREFERSKRQSSELVRMYGWRIIDSNAMPEQMKESDIDRFYHYCQFAREEDSSSPTICWKILVEDRMDSSPQSPKLLKCLEELRLSEPRVQAHAVVFFQEFRLLNDYAPYPIGDPYSPESERFGRIVERVWQKRGEQILASINHDLVVAAIRTKLRQAPEKYIRDRFLKAPPKERS